MGVMLASRTLRRYPFNLTDSNRPRARGLRGRVPRRPRVYWSHVAGSEIVGLIPARPSSSPAHISCLPDYFRPEFVLENRLASASLRWD